MNHATENLERELKKEAKHTTASLKERIVTLTRLQANNSLFLEKGENNKMFINDVPDEVLKEVACELQVPFHRPDRILGYAYAIIRTSWGSIELNGVQKEIITTYK